MNPGNRLLSKKWQTATGAALEFFRGPLPWTGPGTDRLLRSVISRYPGFRLTHFLTGAFRDRAAWSSLVGRRRCAPSLNSRGVNETHSRYLVCGGTTFLLSLLSLKRLHEPKQYFNFQYLPSLPSTDVCENGMGMKILKNKHKKPNATINAIQKNREQDNMMNGYINIIKFYKRKDVNKYRET